MEERSELSLMHEFLYQRNEQTLAHEILWQGDSVLCVGARLRLIVPVNKPAANSRLTSVSSNPDDVFAIPSDYQFRPIRIWPELLGLPRSTGPRNTSPKTSSGEPPSGTGASDTGSNTPPVSG